jgi:hypothetical protein
MDSCAVVSVVWSLASFIRVPSHESAPSHPALPLGLSFSFSLGHVCVPVCLRVHAVLLIFAPALFCAALYPVCVLLPVHV